MKKLSAFLVLLVAACSTSNSPKSTPDAATTPPPTTSDCFMGVPQTHDDLINACVDKTVTRIIKHPSLPLLNSDGSLPPPP